jgi:rhamnosyltransferase
MQKEESAIQSVSIIIPTYQGAAYLEETLAALCEQTYPAPVEIIAVDSGSTDNTVAILQRYEASVIRIPKQQFSHGYSRNLGAHKARYPVLVFMSQDALPLGTDWLCKLVRTLDDPTIGAAFARQLPRPNATPLEAFFNLQLYPPHSMMLSPHSGFAIPLEAIFFSNVCSVVHRETWLAHPFDETLIMSEDQAFSRDLLRTGYKIYYNADIAVIHSHAYDLKTLFRRNFDSAYSLRGVADDTWGYVMRKGVEYVVKEIGYVVQKRAWQWLFVVPVYEATRTLGRVLGSHAHHLPQSWRKTLSLHSQYWSREPVTR